MGKWRRSATSRQSTAAEASRAGLLRCSAPASARLGREGPSTLTSSRGHECRKGRRALRYPVQCSLRRYFKFASLQPELGDDAEVIFRFRLGAPPCPRQLAPGKHVCK